MLETQIKQGAPADIFASAAPLNTQRLFAAGIVDKPVTFTANRLALIVPKSNPAGLKSVYDLKSKNVKLVIANAAVPVGGYTRTVLKKMGLSSVLSKVVSQESDVKAVTGKVALGQADAGFVYVTDARAVERSGDRDPDPGVGAAARTLRDRGRLEVRQQGRGTGMDQGDPLRQGPGRAEEATASCRFPRHRRRQGLPGDARPRDGRRPAVPAAAGRGDLPPRAARRPRLRARDERREGRARRHGRDERCLDGPDPRVRHADRVLGGHADVPVTRSRRHADRASARASARRCRASACSSRSGGSGLLGGTFDALGIDIAFTKIAVVLAVTFVASPFYVRTAVSAFEGMDPTLPAAARTLGAGPGRVFFRVALPLAAGGLGAGAALAFARGIGEFGATIMFAGSLQGVTQTLSLAIYEQFDVEFDIALAISAVLVLISAVTLLSVKLLTRWRSTSTSPIPFAASTRPSS